jgi:hypothetical protein
MQHLAPTVSDNPEISSGELVALLDKIGSAILVTHSQSGLFGWLVGSRSSNVMGIISYEPGFVFPSLVRYRTAAIRQPAASFLGKCDAPPRYGGPLAQKNKNLKPEIDEAQTLRDRPALSVPSLTAVMMEG